MWLVGLKKDWKQWELVGVFSTKNKGLDVCRSKKHFIAEVKLDEDYGDPTSKYGKAWCPLQENEPEE